MQDNVVDINKIKDIKAFVETANERIIDLEQCLYDILECSRLDVAKEMAADVLDEDLDSYLEEDNLEELDFDNDQCVTHFNSDEDR